MRPAIDSADPSEWINGSKARQLLDCTATALQRAAVVGLIQVKLDPGQPPRYNRTDVERYKDQLPPKAERRQHYARKKTAGSGPSLAG